MQATASPFNSWCYLETCRSNVDEVKVKRITDGIGYKMWQVRDRYLVYTVVVWYMNLEATNSGFGVISGCRHPCFTNLLRDLQWKPVMNIYAVTWRLTRCRSCILRAAMRRFAALITPVSISLFDAAGAQRCAKCECPFSPQQQRHRIGH